VQDTILIIGAGSIGDTVVALPCFNAIFRKYENCRRVLLTRTPENARFTSPMNVLGETVVDDVFEFEFGSWKTSAIVQLAQRIRALKPQLAIFIHPGNGFLNEGPGSVKFIWRQMAFLRICGVKEFVGLPAALSLFRNQLDPISGLYEQQAVFLARRLSEIGPVPVDTDAAWDLRLTAKENDTATRLLGPLAEQPFIVFHMGTKQQEGRDWGEPNWRLLCERLAARYPDMGLVAIGAPTDSDRAKRVQSFWKGMTFNACGQGSVRETTAVISRARLFVGHDSGPGHLAAAVRTPIVSIHSDIELPGKWHPFGPNVKVLRSQGPIETISVDDVFEAVLRQLA
jgi:ADP-heptose:LPS heptosyltransferase